MLSLDESIDDLLEFWKKTPFDSKSVSLDATKQLAETITHQRDAAETILHKLRGTPSISQLSAITDGAAVWEYFTALFQAVGRHHEALSLAFGLYDEMSIKERLTGNRIHKGMPLFRIADAYRSLGYVVHEERYLMLTLCEDAIREQGKVSPNSTGIYYRLVWGLGFSDAQVRRYAAEFYSAFKKQKAHPMFPEALLQDIDKQRRWQVRAPAPAEMATYRVNPLYIGALLEGLGEGSGLSLERLAEYLLSCMPGCRTRSRVASRVTDFDVMCSMNGTYHDFRSEFGRYFVCECKDWAKRSGISVIAKFCRILDSTKSRFGILFLRAGLAGMKNGSHAAREQQKIFQDRGLVIVVVDESDIRAVAGGENFIQLLREKYEAARLDLGERRAHKPKRKGLARESA